MRLAVSGADQARAMRAAALGGAGQPARGQALQVQVRFTHRRGALGAGNDIEKGMYTLQEAMVRCASLPLAKGFTFFGPPNPAPATKVEVFFKRSLEGNDDPEWQTFVKGQSQAQGGPASAHPGQTPGKRFFDAVTKNRVADATALLAAHASREPVHGRHPFVTASHAGWTALAIAAWHGHTEMLLVLLRAGAPVNIASQHGETAVYLAAQHGNLDAVKLLVENRADPAQANQKGADALCIATEQGRESVARYLVEQAGMSVNSHLHCGSNVLWLAAKGGHSKIVAWLLEQDAKISANNDGMTPYHAASCRGQHAVLEVLLKHAEKDPGRVARVQAAADDSASMAASLTARAKALSTQLSRAQLDLPDRLQRMADARERCKAAAEALAAAERESDAARADVLAVPQVRKRLCFSHLYIKTNMLPRQARDKHRETQKQAVFSQGFELDLDPPVGKTPLCAPFVYKNDHSTKTGSGQT